MWVLQGPGVALWNVVLQGPGVAERNPTWARHDYGGMLSGAGMESMLQGPEITAGGTTGPRVGCVECHSDPWPQEHPPSMSFVL